MRGIFRASFARTFVNKSNLPISRSWLLAARHRLRLALTLYAAGPAEPTGRGTLPFSRSRDAIKSVGHDKIGTSGDSKSKALEFNRWQNGTRNASGITDPLYFVKANATYCCIYTPPMSSSHTATPIRR